MTELDVSIGLVGVVKMLRLLDVLRKAGEEGKQVQLDARFLDAASEAAQADAHRIGEFVANLTGDRREEFARQCFGARADDVAAFLGLDTALNN